MEEAYLITIQQGYDRKWFWKAYGKSGQVLALQEEQPDAPACLEALITWFMPAPEDHQASKPARRKKPAKKSAGRRAAQT